MFPVFYPNFASIILALASIAMEQSLRLFLTRQRIFGLAMGDETMELVNLGEFQP
jgi:hypothetical protein